MTYAPLKPRIVAPAARQPHKKPSTLKGMGLGPVHASDPRTKLVVGESNDPLGADFSNVGAADSESHIHAAKPAVAVQPRLEVGPADSPLEEEADAVAEVVTQRLAGTDGDGPGLRPSISSTRESRLQRSCAACSQRDEDEVGMSLQRRASELQPARRAVELSSLAQVRAEGGRQIPLRVRAPLESMLGHDFSSVRIHTGPLARRVARGLGAEAFTSRNDVVFARDRYRPDTPEGLNLLAHELVHTIQQRASRPMSNALPVARAPTHAQARMAPPSVEEQPGEEVCSPWAAVLCEQVDLTTVARDVQLEALRELAREIDRVEAELRESEGWSGDGAATSKLAQSAMKGLRDKATAVVAAGPEKPTPYKPPDKGGVFGEERLEMLLRAMIVRLRTIELRREGDDPATAASTVLIDWQHRMDTSKLGRPPASEPTPHDIRAFTADFVLTQHAVRAADLDGNLQAVEDLVTAIELRRKALREHSRQGQPIENYFVHLQPFVQAAIDELVRRAASKQAIREELRRLFVVLKRLEGVVFREIPDPSDSERNVRLGSLQVDSTKGPLDASEGRHDDFFGTKASVKVYPYSVEGGFDQGQLQLSILELTRSRIKQVEFLAEIYGNRLHRSDETDATDKVRAELAQLDGRGFDLHSDSDWREYLLKRLHEHRQTGATDEVAYRDLVETVRIYFATFAVHSPYNIEDFGDSYIDRDFPRALSGQLIHDCGVYALRVAYMLSLVRKELGLTFHFVRLPFHFALVIRGGDGLPTLIVNNDDLEWVEDGAARELVKQHNLGEAQLAGELASHHFAPGTRMPFFTSELGPRDFDKKSMWREYKELSGKNPFSEAVADPASPLHGRDLAYLEYMRTAIDAFNESVYVLWTGTLPSLWRSSRGQLRKCRMSGGPDESRTAAESMACEVEILQEYRRKSRSRTIKAINTYLAATTTALAAVPSAIPPQLVLGLVPSGTRLLNLGSTQIPARTRGLEPGLAAQGAAESHPEIMFDSGSRPASAPATRVELIKFLILSVQDAELDMANAVVHGDSFEILYADSPADPATGVQFGTSDKDAPAEYLPPFARREYQIERLR